MLYRFLLFLGSCILGSLSVVSAQTFHAVIVAATADPVLNTACEEDMARMTTNFHQIANALSYPLNLITVSREQFNRTGVDQALQKIQCSPKDIIFFYYTGHGYNLSSRTSPYPILQLEKDASRNLGLDEIHLLLKQKGPRMCISMGDCCNKVYSGKPVINRSIPRGLTVSTEIIKKLFTIPQGDVLVASSKRDQVSGAYITGSFYTLGFDQALNHALHYNQQIDWQRLLSDAQGCMESLDAARQNGQKSIFAANITGTTQPTTSTDTTVAPPSPQPAADTPPATTTDLSPKPAPSAPTGPDYAVINRLLNQLADESLSIAQRRQLRQQAMAYFVQNAEVRLYQNETEVDHQPIETALARLFINADKIQRVNVIERRSVVSADGQKYQVVGWQEEWSEDSK